MLIEIKNQDGSASVWVNPANPAVVVIVPSPLAQNPQCQVLTGGPVIVNTSETEARKLIAACNGGPVS